MPNFILYHTPVFYLIQSLWRDEAFSYFLSKPNILQIITTTANDFNPPLYYIILHFWIQVVGKSDIGLRLLSFIFHLATVYVSYKLASALFSKNFAKFVAIFTFLNPMLLYYSFEIRMYSLYTLLTFTSLYFFYTKKWKSYILATTLGLYTHSFFLLIPFCFILYLLTTKQLTKKTLLLTTTPFILYLPWIPVIISQFVNSSNSWLYPVDFQLVKSSLGNIFTNFEGAPYWGWNYTAALSAIILISLLFAFKNKKQQALLLILPVIIPLTLILTYSIIRRPIYVNRYLIFIAVFEILGISLAVKTIKNTLIKYSCASLWLVLIIAIDLIMPPSRAKTDFKKTFEKINPSATQNDYVYTKTPVAFFESAYYYQYSDKVFVYNPQNIQIPKYLGMNDLFKDVSKPTFPPSPAKIFLISDNASFEIKNQ